MAHWQLMGKENYTIEDNLKPIIFEVTIIIALFWFLTNQIFSDKITKFRVEKRSTLNRTLTTLVILCRGCKPSCTVLR